MNIDGIKAFLSLPFPLEIAVAIAATAVLLAIFSRRPIVHFVRLIVSRIPNKWVTEVLDERLISTVFWILPFMVAVAGTHSIDGVSEKLITYADRLFQALLIIVGLRAITVFLWNVNRSYSALEVARDRPIKGLIQVTLIVLHLFALILVVAVLMDRSPWIFLSGLGAMTAVLLLIFRDTILSLVAGFQLTTNNFVRVGDWIEMPQFGADGDVIDIALHAVRVQNWDKTITVIPTHKFLEHSFKNWRGMSESGGRRIKRSVQIDMSTIRFLKEDEIQKFSKFVLLRDYIAGKAQELKEHNRQYDGDPEAIVNSRRLTNVGTFRAYLTAYLRQHPKIHQNMTFLVRQLPPTAEGLPLEVYVFTNDTRWALYEGIQADIFDHILAIAKEFDLRVFQNPSGHDFQAKFNR